MNINRDHCRKNYIICYLIEQKVVSSFQQKRSKTKLMLPNCFFDHLQPFLVLPIFDQVPNKGSFLVKFINLSSSYHGEWKLH